MPFWDGQPRHPPSAGRENATPVIRTGVTPGYLPSVTQNGPRTSLTGGIEFVTVNQTFT